MKISTTSPFQEYAGSLNEGKAAMLEEFFSNFNCHCILARAEKRKIKRGL